VRGAAPSIVCPRCEQEAPPQEALGKFATCRSCGLVFDAAPRDRQVPVRRRRTEAEAEVEREPESEPEPEPEPEPERKGAPPWQRRLTPLQIVAVLIGIVGLAVLLEGREPAEQRSTEEPAALRAQRYRERHRLADRFAGYGTESCAALGEALGRALVCPDPASELRLLGELEAVMEQPDFSAGICSVLLAEVDIMLLMLRCVHP
jgi:hypothetical protein